MRTLQDELRAHMERLVEGQELSIVNINSGAIIEAFDAALQDVIRNCADINTTAGNREVSLKLTIKPSKDRAMVFFKGAVNRKLAGMEPIEGMANVEISGSGAGPIATRRPDAIQEPLFSNVKSIKP